MPIVQRNIDEKKMRNENHNSTELKAKACQLLLEKCMCVSINWKHHKAWNIKRKGTTGGNEFSKKQNLMNKEEKEKTHIEK